jgi:hypothetical protein
MESRGKVEAKNNGTDAILVVRGTEVKKKQESVYLLNLWQAQLHLPEAPFL